MLTKRLILRKLTSADFPCVKDMCNDSEVMKFIGPRRAMNENEISIWFNNQLDSFQNKNNRYAVALRENNEFIGMVGIQISDPRDFGYYFRRKYWSCGYAFEACEAVLKLLNGVDFYIFICDDNINSINLVKKLGYVKNERAVKDNEVGYYYTKL